MMMMKFLLLSSVQVELVKVASGATGADAAQMLGRVELCFFVPGGSASFFWFSGERLEYTSHKELCWSLPVVSEDP